MLYLKAQLKCTLWIFLAAAKLELKIASERSVFCTLLIAYIWYSALWCSSTCFSCSPSFSASNLSLIIFFLFVFTSLASVPLLCLSCFPSPASNAVPHFNLANHCSCASLFPSKALNDFFQGRIMYSFAYTADPWTLRGRGRFRGPNLPLKDNLQWALRMRGSSLSRFLHILGSACAFRKTEIL